MLKRTLHFHQRDYILTFFSFAKPMSLAPEIPEIVSSNFFSIFSAEVTHIFRHLLQSGNENRIKLTLKMNVFILNALKRLLRWSSLIDFYFIFWKAIDKNINGY